MRSAVFSDEDDVVKMLLGIMPHDDKPFFRDKAACALAYDQIAFSPQTPGRMIRAGMRRCLRPYTPGNWVARRWHTTTGSCGRGRLFAEAGLTTAVPVMVP